MRPKQCFSRSLCFSFFVGLVLLGGSSGLQAGPLFSVVTLGASPAGAGLAFNSSGTAVGYYTDNLGNTDSASFSGGTAKQLGTNGVATAINDSGIVVGYSYSGSSTVVTEWVGGNNNALGLTGAATGVNNLGEIVGGYSPTSTTMHAFTLANNRMTDLGTLGGSWSSAFAVNNAGVVAGTSTLANGRDDAFYYKAGVMQGLGTLGGANSYGLAISQNGFVAGNSQTSAGYLHGFVWNGSGMQDLGTLGGTMSSANGVNSSGWVVGSSTTKGNISTDAFLWQSGVMQDLNALLPVGSGWTLTDAYAINDAGDILATGISAGNEYAVELVPTSVPATIPEPEVLAITALGLVIVSRIARKRHRRTT